jgi:cell division septation protein DedD
VVNVDTSAPRTDALWPHAATLVLAAETPRQRRWAVSTAIEIVRKLAEQHPKVVLADLQMRSPSALAAALGIDGGPGIVDVLFRDAAFSAVARKPDSETFYFLAVGSSSPPINVLYQHPRWKKIAARLPDNDARLLPCVSAQDWLEAGPIPGFESCIVLNAAGLEVELPAEARRVAEFLAPPEIREEEPGSVELPWYASSDDTQPIPGMVKRPISDPGPRVEESPSPAAGSATPDDAPMRTPPTPDRAPLEAFSDGPTTPPGPLFRPRRRRRVIPVAGVAAAAALVFVLWRTVGSRQISEDPTSLEAAAETVAVPAETPTANEPVDQPTNGPLDEPAAPGPRLSEVSLPYSVAIASFSSMDDAVARQREWTRADLPFYVAPTVVRGVVYYRVFAGMLPGREQAEALMAQLVREEIKDTVRSWDVRPVRLAFSFGTYSSSEDARVVLETLFGRGVPAYMVPAVGQADSIAYRVYAGGYEKPEDASPLQEHIARAGLDVELVERVGLQLK